METRKPEQNARENIDALLGAAGWVVQDYRAFNPSAARGIALREVPLKSGRCDYLLMVDRQPVGVIEAKRAGTTLSAVADQSGHYAENLPDFLAALLPAQIAQLPFLYESTGIETLFRDGRDPEPRSRHVFAFHQPSTLAGWLAEPNTLRARLRRLAIDHPLADGGNGAARSGLGASPMRSCQTEAITSLEKSFRRADPIETFDFIVTDECHRSIYGLWRQVLEYFDAFTIGLTATPSKQTIGFFGQNLVTEYNHERAVADGVNVGYEVFRIRTQVSELTGDLPHWRQEGVTYFVTFRLADSLPAERLAQWRDEMTLWLREHPEPHDEATRQAFYERFPGRLQQWLDAGVGSCVLAIPEVRVLVEDALRHFDGQRYSLDEFVVAPNHVHALVTPAGGHELSEILHPWKSITAHEIVKVEAASRRLAAAARPRNAAVYSQKSRAGSESESGSGVSPLKLRKSRDGSSTLTVWQKESFDHIVRSPASLEKFREYIRAHKVDDASRLVVSEELRRDAAATLVTAACAPFDNPAFRDALAMAKQEAEQTIDTVTIDTVVAKGFDAAAKAKAAGLVKSFRDFIEAHRAEIAALQILYSRPYAQRLTEALLKQLESKLRDEVRFGPDPVNSLWWAFEQSGSGVPPLGLANRRYGASTLHRFADLVPLVRFALEQQPVLKPFAESVGERFNEWMMDKARAGTTFTPDQLAWLNLIRDHIATTLSIEPDDFEFPPSLSAAAWGKRTSFSATRFPPSWKN